MARVLFPTLAGAQPFPQTQTLIRPLSPSILTSRRSKSDCSGVFFSIDRSKSIRNVTVHRSTPDWLRFLPGSSFWVSPPPPPPPGTNTNLDSALVGKEEERPSFDYFLEGASPRQVPCLAKVASKPVVTVHRSKKVASEPVVTVHRSKKVVSKPAVKVHRSDKDALKPVVTLHRSEMAASKPVVTVHRSEKFASKPDKDE